jgi:hypothetical protein
MTGDRARGTVVVALASLLLLRVTAEPHAA